MDKTHELEFHSNLKNLIIDIEKLKNVPNLSFEGKKFTEEEKAEYRLLKLAELKTRIDYIAHEYKVNAPFDIGLSVPPTLPEIGAKVGTTQSHGLKKQ
jgi:hypothetical protein